MFLCVNKSAHYNKAINFKKKIVFLELHRSVEVCWLVTETYVSVIKNTV